MKSKTFLKNGVQEHQLVIRRDFRTSPARLFDAWTTPTTLMKWWGPKGFTSPACKVDLQVGGEYHFCMRSPEGVDFWSKGTFRQIEPGKKIVATDSFSDRYGNIITASSVGLPGDWPSTLLITVIFQRVDQGTRFTLIHQGLPEEMLESCRVGWNESLDKLQQII